MSSLDHLSNATPLGRNEIKGITYVLNTLFENPDSDNFRNPVDHVAYGLNDYLKIVKTPMDLGTIKQNLKTGKYKFVEEIINDIQLIWDNCKLYNVEGSYIVGVAKQNEKLMIKCVKSMFPNIQLKSAKEETVTEGMISQNIYMTKQQKNDLYNHTKLLNAQQLGKLVVIIHDKCPEAYAEVEYNKCQILMDMITRDLYVLINRKVNSWLSQNNENVKKKVKTN